MRCKLIKECEGSNPELDPRNPDSPHSITHPVGTTIEGPKVWMHVCLGRAIPDDEECWKRVEKRNPLIVEKILKRFPDARKKTEAPADTGGQPATDPPKPRKPKGGEAPPAA